MNIIEKELLAIVFACEKFDQYVYGRDKVHVQSDHKPLEVIFERPLVTVPKRLQRMLLPLQQYSLEVIVRGSEMHIADTLSQSHIPAALGFTQSCSQRSTCPGDSQSTAGATICQRA